MGIFEKRRFKGFLQFVQDVNEDDPATWKGNDLKNMTMQAVFDKFGLDANTADFTGHALALYTDDRYGHATFNNIVLKKYFSSFIHLTVLIVFETHDLCIYILCLTESICFQLPSEASNGDPT